MSAAVAGWELRFSKRAQKDKARLEEAGLWAGVLELLQAIRRNPRHTPPPYEKLKGDLVGMLSRRITYTHRLVYEVDQEARVVKILAMWTHCVVKSTVEAEPTAEDVPAALDREAAEEAEA